MAYDIERYLNIRGAGAPSFGPDGELAFLMNTTGVNQVWRLDEPGRWPEQLTFYEESVGFAAWSPERPELVFGMDEGGNERTQLYRLDGDGETVTPLTDAPDAKHQWGGWSHDGERFAFTSNRRDEGVFDVYVQGREETGDDAELLAEGDGWLVVLGWSPDDSRLAVMDYHSNYDQDLYVLDVAAGDLRPVHPHEADVRYGSVSWGPDGDALYVTTDADADTLQLVRLDLATGDLATVVDGDGWNVESATVHHDTGRVVYARNVDGATDLRVGDLDGATVDPLPAPDLPAGVYGGATFDADAARLAVAVTGDTANANVYVVDVATGEATRWTHAATAGIPESSFVASELVRFESFDGLEVPAFLSVPREGAGPFPVVVDVHGGPESQRRPAFSGLKQYFLDSGYAVFEPNVRGSTGYGERYTRLDDVRNRMDSVADLAAGVEWLGDRPAVDPDRVVAYGGSYGGFMVLSALTTYPDLWAAGVDIVGIANFITFLKNTGAWRRSQREAEYGSLDEDREFLEEISPINNIANIEAPLLVLHGENDPRVPVGEAEQIAEEAAKHVPVETLVFEDEGHGFAKLENRITAYRTVVEFMDEYV